MLIAIITETFTFEIRCKMLDKSSSISDF